VRKEQLSWINSVFLKTCDTVHGHVFCPPSGPAGSAIYSVYEVFMFSVLFSSAVQVECFVDLIKFAIVFRVTVWTQFRQVTDYMRARALRLSPLSVREQYTVFLYVVVTKQAKRFSIVFLSPPETRSVSCVILKGRWGGGGEAK
jgi:hypothetical protein